MENTWPVWVYPRIESLNVGDVLLTQDVEEALAALNQGRKVLFSPKMSYLKGLEGKFLPVFWSPVHFPRQAGTMGLLCNTQHAALRHFPTEMHSNWQWWNLVKRSKYWLSIRYRRLNRLWNLLTILQTTEVGICL